MSNVFTTIETDLKAFFSGLLSVVKSDIVLDVLPAVGKSATSLATNPTVGNFVAQGTAIQAAIIEAGPEVGQDALKYVADAINTEVQAQIAKLPVSPASAAAAA